MTDILDPLINTVYDMAVETHGKFPGFLGRNTEDFSKEQLIKLCTILHGSIQDAKDRMNEEVCFTSELLKALK